MQVKMNGCILTNNLKIFKRNFHLNPLCQISGYFMVDRTMKNTLPFI